MEVRTLISIAPSLEFVVNLLSNKCLLKLKIHHHTKYIVPLIVSFSFTWMWLWTYHTVILSLKWIVHIFINVFLPVCQFLVLQLYPEPQFLQDSYEFSPFICTSLRTISESKRSLKREHLHTCLYFWICTDLLEVIGMWPALSSSWSLAFDIWLLFLKELLWVSTSVWISWEEITMTWI